MMITDTEELVLKIGHQAHVKVSASASAYRAGVCAEKKYGQCNNCHPYCFFEHGNELYRFEKAAQQDARRYFKNETELFSTRERPADEISRAATPGIFLIQKVAGL